MSDDDLRPATWSRPGKDHKEDAIAGTYHVDATGHPIAQLHGVWQDEQHLPFGGEMPPLLHGDAFGRAVTLVAPRSGRSSRGFSDLQNTTLHARYAVEGLWLQEEDLSLTEVRVSLWDQDIWTGWNAYFGRIPPNSRWKWPTEFFYDPPAPRQAEFAWGTLVLEDGSSWSQLHQPTGWRLESGSRFVLRFNEPIPIGEVRTRYLAPIEFLISSATGRSSGVRNIHGTNSTWEITGFPDNWPPNEPDRWVTLRIPHLPRPDGDIESHSLLHLESDFEFATQLPKVFDVAQQARYSLEHFTALKADRATGSLAEFVATSQLVESFDRSLHPTPLGGSDTRDLNTRLTRLDGESGNLINDLLGHKRWRDDVRRLRNMVVHGEEGSAFLTRDARPLQAATAILMLLFEARLLVAEGFDSTRAKELVERRLHHWQIKDLIARSYGHLAGLVRDNP